MNLLLSIKRIYIIKDGEREDIKGLTDIYVWANYNKNEKGEYDHYYDKNTLPSEIYELTAQDFGWCTGLVIDKSTKRWITFHSGSNSADWGGCWGIGTNPTGGGNDSSPIIFSFDGIQNTINGIINAAGSMPMYLSPRKF
ncbi:MAG TPA: hypothetical protein PKK00_01660 [Bacteroidales bacterium]|nr:hypothetical protein [Bacteroidales bacterium]HPS16161.1 hypothetical protein [Bacteroidales bacterium]